MMVEDDDDDSTHIVGLHSYVVGPSYPFDSSYAEADECGKHPRKQIHMRIPTNALFTTDLTPLLPRENFFRIDFFGLVELELLLLLLARGGGF